MLTLTTPYNHPLGNGLVMKSIRDMSDVERLTAFDIQIFGQDIEEFVTALIVHHPATRPEHWLYIEDEMTRQIVAALSLIPWEKESSVSVRQACKNFQGNKVRVFIGPEGGWETDEVERARRHGIVPVRLGPTLLRSETAGVVAATLILSECGVYA